MKHEHTTTCEHEIKVCDCCDTAYCSKCKKEWGAQQPCNLNHWPTTYIPYYPRPIWATPYPYFTDPTYGTSITTGSPNLCNNTMLQSGTLHAY